MKVLLFFLLFGFSIADIDYEPYVNEDGINPYSDRNYNNPIFSEFTPLSTETVKDLNKLRNLRVLQFYESLEELYLTGGFEKSGTINNIILSQKEIPNFTFDLLIRTLKITRKELKNGDSSLSELNSVLKEETDEQTKQLLESVKKAIQNSTETTNEESFIQQITEIQLESKEDLKNLNLKNGKNGEKLVKLLGELKKKISSKDMETISKAVQNGFYSDIGGTNDIKNTLIAGSRMIYNLGGSIDETKKKCLEIGHALEKDSRFKRKLDSGLEIVKRLNRTDGEFGYKMLFDAYFDSQYPEGSMIFLPSRIITIETIHPFFVALEKGETDILLKMIASVSKDRSRLHQFQSFIDRLQNDTLNASILMTKRFGTEVSLEDVPIYRSILEYITSFSVDSAYFLRYLRSIKDIIDTGNYHNFMNSLVRFSRLSRDDRWRDVWNAIKEASDIIASMEDEIIDPFRGLNETVSGSYEEIFHSMKMILEGGNVEAKCQFIEEFFSGLEDRDNVLEAIGIPVSKIHGWIDSTEYIDALVDVLNAADTYPNLNRLLEFHGKYTTVDKKPLESMDLIDNFIRYLDQSGRWNKKKFRSSKY